MFNNTMDYNVLAGDVIVAVVPFEFVQQAQEEFPESIGYRFERRREQVPVAHDRRSK